MHGSCRHGWMRDAAESRVLVNRRSGSDPMQILSVNPSGHVTRTGRARQPRFLPIVIAAAPCNEAAVACAHHLPWPLALAASGSPPPSPRAAVRDHLQQGMQAGQRRASGPAGQLQLRSEASGPPAARPQASGMRQRRATDQANTSAVPGFGVSSRCRSVRPSRSRLYLKKKKKNLSSLYLCTGP